jgi:hypothetical protein
MLPLLSFNPDLTFKDGVLFLLLMKKLALKCVDVCDLFFSHSHSIFKPKVKLLSSLQSLYLLLQSNNNYQWAF